MADPVMVPPTKGEPLPEVVQELPGLTSETLLADLNDAMQRLAETDPVLFIGVRHHSPACAAAVPELLQRFQPEQVLIELPMELGEWLPWLGHPETLSPVALAASSPTGESQGFYPFADFSPELAAVRYAVAHGLPVAPFDLPLLARATEEDVENTAESPEDGPDGTDADGTGAAHSESSLFARLMDALELSSGEALWDRLVEARAFGADAESVRRAGLLFGYLSRLDSLAPGLSPFGSEDGAAAQTGVSAHDLAREAFMRERLCDALGIGTGKALTRERNASDRVTHSSHQLPRIAVIAGAFHIPALVSVVTSLHGLAPDASVSVPARVPVREEIPAPSERILKTSEKNREKARISSDASAEKEVPRLVTALIPYSFELLDSRSGYPAGIRDPRWQQRVWQARQKGPERDTESPSSLPPHWPLEALSEGGIRPVSMPTTEPPDLETLAADVIVEVCRRMRAAGHVAGTADAQSCLRMAIDLARLRGLPGPDRQEVLEALQSGLGQGEAVGRGRVLAQALEPVMIGRARGQLAPRAPRSGLLPHVLTLLERLRLPGPDAESRKPERLRLDPLRSPLDRERHLCLQRLVACHVPYGKLEEGTAAGDVETLTRTWTVQWTPSTDASLAVAGLWGLSLKQAAEGSLRAQIRAEQGAQARLKAAPPLGASSTVRPGAGRPGKRLPLESIEGLTPPLHLALLEQAASCGLPELSNGLLEGLMGAFIQTAGLGELVAARLLLLRLEQGHLIGLQPTHPGLAAASSELPGASGSVGDGGDEPVTPRGDADGDWQMPDSVEPSLLLGAAVAALEGLAGSNSGADGVALLELIRLFQAQEPSHALGSSRLLTILRQFSENGSPFMQGAGGAGLVLLDALPAEAFAARLGSWVDAAGGAEPIRGSSEAAPGVEGKADGLTSAATHPESSGEGSRVLAARLEGALVLASARLEADPTLLDGLNQRVEALSDPAFLSRLPALRQGFSGLSPAARGRLLEALGERLEDKRPGAVTRLETTLELSPTWLALFAAADGAGQKRAGVSWTEPGASQAASQATPAGTDGAAQAGARVQVPAREATGRLQAGKRASDKADSTGDSSANLANYSAGTVADTPAERVGQMAGTPSNLMAPSQRQSSSFHQLSARDRWRLILGREKDQLSGQARRMARALDELYGSGKGEGSRAPGALGGPGGSGDPPFPTTRAWADELEALFGTPIREEVLGRAAESGRVQAALELDPASVTPSVALLETVLSLKGSLPESRLGQLRALVARVVEALVEALSRRLRPALAGLSLPRVTRRAMGPLDLRRTVRANLDRVRTGEDGRLTLIPERLYFKTRARKSLDWHLFLVVDVSGSMEASVIYSAMMAAILNGLPALSVQFLAFSTEVVDFSARVDDPLGLLLEVSVGGGTHIGKALKTARSRVTVPARTLLVLVTDFEEGASPADLLGEVRELVDMGVKPLGLAALDDRGQPRYNRALAERVVDAGMPVAALTPLELARWVGEQIR